MKIGDLVKINPTTELKEKHGKVCFVEEILGRKFGVKRDNQVRLYSIEGEYFGDWFEDEFTKLGDRITEKELIEIISKNINNVGLVNDLIRVMALIKTGHWITPGIPELYQDIKKKELFLKNQGVLNENA